MRKQKRYITLNSSQVNAGIVAQYKRDLQQLVKQMIATYTKELLAMYKDNKEEITDIRTAQDAGIADDYAKKMQQLNEVYEKYFAKHGKQKAEEMVSKVAQAQQRSFIRDYAKFMFLALNDKNIKPEDKIFAEFLQKSFAPKNFLPTEAGKKAFLEAFTLNVKPYHEIAETIKQTTITNNVELIKSIHQQYHREVSQALYDSIINGKPRRTVTEKLLEAGVKTKRRARLIADDQCNKIYNALYLQSLKQSGFTKARWVHLGGGKTDRKTHVTHAPKGLNGAIFDVAKGMYDPAVQRYIKPGELPFCHCKAIGVAEV